MAIMAILYYDQSLPSRSSALYMTYPYKASTIVAIMAILYILMRAQLWQFCTMTYPYRAGLR